MIANAYADEGAHLASTGRRRDFAADEPPARGFGVQRRHQLWLPQRHAVPVQPCHIKPIAGLKCPVDFHLHQRRRAHGIGDIAGAAQEPGREPVTLAGSDGDRSAGIARHPRCRHRVGEGQGVVAAVSRRDDNADIQSLVKGFTPVIEAGLKAGIGDQVGRDDAAGVAEVTQDKGRRRNRDQLLTVDSQAADLAVFGQGEGQAVGGGEGVVWGSRTLAGEHTI